MQIDSISRSKGWNQPGDLQSTEIPSSKLACDGHMEFASPDVDCFV